MIILDIGIIGIGNMGKNHARIYSEMRGIDDIYIYDIDKKNSELYAKNIGATACKTIDELYGYIDAVSICTPTKYHLQSIKEAITYNTPFLVEKPICSNLKEAEEILEITPNHIVSGVGHIERFNPIIHEIKKILRKPIYVDIKRHNPNSSRITDSTIIEDLMIHDIDILFHTIFSNYPKYNLTCTGNEDTCSSTFLFANTPAHISASRKASKKVRNIYIEDEDFTIEGDFINQELYIYKRPQQYDIKNRIYTQENIVEKILINKIEPLREELSKFIWCISNHKSFPVSIEQATFNLSVCEYIKNNLME